MREQHYQSIMTNISNGRVKPTQPPTVPPDYYGTLTNRLSSGRIIFLLTDLIITIKWRKTFSQY
jgi:hypothetical protein